MNADKKKLAILGVLALLMIGVGAFTFLGRGAAPAATSNLVQADAGTPTDTSSDPNAELVEIDPNTGEPITVDPNAQTAQGQGEVAGQTVFAMAPFGPRDPFMVPASLQKEDQTPEPPRPAPEPTRRPDPIASTGSTSPFNPGISGPLPTVPGAGGSAPVLEVKPQFVVKGVLLGRKPIAVLEDSSGNQRLVALGGSIDGDTKIVAIDEGGITVIHKGKRMKFALQEEARND